ncbi:CocE/NonD family hydrolase [Okibacterium endophyticum]
MNDHAMSSGTEQGGVEVLRTGPSAVDERATSAMVPMSDGVSLATDAYLGGQVRPRPVILVRLPYDKSGRYTFMPQLAERANDRGYILVAQDVRGKFRSGGITLPCQPHEVTDAYDTLEWLVTQPWCDGSVVMIGDSYYGYTQWAAVASRHPALRAIAPGVTTAEMHLTGRQPRGAVFLLGQTQYVSTVWLDNDIYDFDVDWSHRPLAEVFDDVFAEIGGRSPAFDAILDNWDDDEARGATWHTHPFEVNTVPVLHRVGWFDNVLPAHMRDYERLVSDPVQAPLQYLLADAIDHENYHLSEAPIDPESDHDTDDQALARLIPRYLDPALDFFDAVLQGTSMPPRVRYMTGHGGWHDAETWPPPGTETLTLYLAPPAAGEPEHHGHLVPEPRAGVRTISWTHDPADLVPSSGANPFAFVLELPDEGYLLERPDVLTFRSEPMNVPIEITGRVILRVRVATSGPSMHLFAKLVDEAPDGTSHMVLRGQVELESPDQETDVELSLGHTAYRIRQGHRLRLHLTSSDFPRYLPHPGSDENPWLATTAVTNEQSVVTGGLSASALALSVVAVDEHRKESPMLHVPHSHGRSSADDSVGSPA